MNRYGHLIFVGLSLAASPVWAQSQDEGVLSTTTTTTTPVYVWTDAKGVRHYTDQPPLNKSKMVPRQVTTAYNNPNASAVSNSGLSPADQQQKEVRLASCATARRNLDLINDPKSTILMEGNTGKTGAVMNETARNQARSLAQQQVDQFCTPQ